MGQNVSAPYLLRWKPVENAAQYIVEMDTFQGPHGAHKARWIWRKTHRTSDVQFAYGPQGTVGGHRWRVTAVSSEGESSQPTDWYLIYGHLHKGDTAWRRNRDSLIRQEQQFARFASALANAPLSE